MGFDLGADDFIVKPFSVREVIARVRAVARRCFARQQPSVPEFQLLDLYVIPSELRAKRGEDVIELSPRDVQSCSYFITTSARCSIAMSSFAMPGAKTISRTAGHSISIFHSCGNELNATPRIRKSSAPSTGPVTGSKVDGAAQGRAVVPDRA